jgi:hypothetical protein
VVSLCQEQGVPFAFMLNRENGRREVLNGSAATHLKKLGVLLPTTLQDRAVYVSTMMRGRTGPEHSDSKQARAAEAEVKALWSAVKFRFHPFRSDRSSGPRLARCLLVPRRRGSRMLQT